MISVVKTAAAGLLLRRHGSRKRGGTDPPKCTTRPPELDSRVWTPPLKPVKILSNLKTAHAHKYLRTNIFIIVNDSKTCSQNARRIRCRVALSPLSCCDRSRFWESPRKSKIRRQLFSACRNRFKGFLNSRQHRSP